VQFDSLKSPIGVSNVRDRPTATEVTVEAR
jgi:hypothetical protein